MERLAEDNTINRIIAMIEEAEEQRRPHSSLWIAARSLYPGVLY